MHGASPISRLLILVVGSLPLSPSSIVGSTTRPALLAPPAATPPFSPSSATRPVVAANYPQLLATAKAHLDSGRAAEALAAASEAIKADGGRYEAYSISGVALVQLGRADEAITTLTQSLQSAPEPKKQAVVKLLEWAKHQRVI